MTRAALRLVAVFVALFFLGTATTASAQSAPSDPAITGEPTPAEQQIIKEEWGRFASVFGGRECLGPVEVRVVDRVEDHYPGRDFGSLASFYLFPPDAIVYIEHGKVNAENLIHEFAHHFDISCSLGERSFGARFIEAQGFEPGHPWLTGESWDTVPAEHFAQAVLAEFGIPSTKITIGPRAERLVASLALDRRSLGPL